MKPGTQHPGGPPRSPLSLLGLGLEMAVPIVLFIYAGHRLDVWLERQPWFMLGGALIGMVLAFYNLFRGLTPPGDRRSGRED